MQRLGKILRFAREAWLVFGVTLLLFVAVEVAFSMMFIPRDSFQSHSGTTLYDGQAMTEAYPAGVWLDDYYRETAESFRTQWVSYVYWRRRAYRGDCINIDANGIRKTWTPDRKHSESAPPKRIFMFGGSTMWGWAARDDYTIPSLVAKELHETGVDCEVVNYGEAGYVTTQEVIALIRQLQRGNTPDMVVFYDGANDIYSTWQQHTAGLPENEFNRAREFNLSHPAHHRLLRKAFLQGEVRRLSVVRFLGGVLRRLGVTSPSDDPASQVKSTSDVPESQDVLARETLAVYLVNMRIVQSLADAYGFKALFYWQPTLFDKPHAAAEEDAQRQKEAAMQPLLQKTCELVQHRDSAAMRGSVFHDLSGIFSDVREPVFVDWCHLSESGNRAIAERIAADILAEDGLAGIASQQTTTTP